MSVFSQSRPIKNMVPREIQGGTFRMISRRNFSLGLAAACAMPHLAVAQNRPVRWLVGYPAGGASDFLARVLSPKLQAAFGQTLVVENRAGAAGIIAMEALAKSDVDGHTIANTGNGELVFN